MTEADVNDRHDFASSRRLAIVAAVVVLALAVWVIWKFGGFNLTTTIAVFGGEQTIENTFASVDHPFHATRGDTLLESLRNGQPLRWIANHQGGYPVEFYPLGIPWLDVGLWALLIGTVPIIAVHKLAVLLVFVLPAAGFWLLARGDRLSPFVPVLALAIHVAMPGLWTHGGMIELIEWGLVANVGGATLAFVALAALARFTLGGNRWVGALAMLLSSAALYTNTRSGIAVGVAAVAVLLGVAMQRPQGNGVSIALAVRRVIVVGVVSGMLTAPLLISMLRYADLYFFVHYMEYTDVRDYWNETLASVSRLLVWVAIAGMVVSIVARQLAAMRIVAVATLLYGGLTVLLSFGDFNQELIQQLETPRLMPFQRLLVIYLAAAAIGYGVDFVVRRGLPRLREPVVATVLIMCAVVAIASFDGEYGTIPEELVTHEVPTTGVQEFAEFTAILAEANEVVPEGTAIYVVGDQKSWWHEQLWGPSQSSAPFFYDDWMWYWHPDFDAPYDFNDGHYIPDPASTFNREWLQANGIGALVVTNMAVPAGDQDPRHAAASNPDLVHQWTVGYWDLYLVRDAGSIVTNGDLQPTSLSIENESIAASFDSASGEIQVRRNWYPRWEAFADGEQVAVERTDSGYMQLTVPEGTTTVELRYAVTGPDWIARLAVAGGLLSVVGLCLGASRLRWLRIDA
jgi:hypothetical protein